MVENQLLAHWLEYGYCIVDNSASDISNIANLFENEYISKFTNQENFNRNLLKCFVNEPLVKKLFLEKILHETLRNLQIEHPIFTGPIVSHYTSHNLTGKGFGLKLHQDWPSMATSDNGVICWVSLSDINENTHGITVIPGSHVNGCQPGEQTNSGYIVEDNFKNKINLGIKKGSYLLMHPWLVHATYVNPECKNFEFKLSISARFDDFKCAQWANRSYRCAYTQIVDREMWAS